MRIFVLTATYELHVSRKSHLRGHPRRGDGELQEGKLLRFRPRIWPLCTFLWTGCDPVRPMEERSLLNRREKQSRNEPTPRLLINQYQSS
jgi:hypothetical protein